MEEFEQFDENPFAGILKQVQSSQQNQGQQPPQQQGGYPPQGMMGNGKTVKSQLNPQENTGTSQYVLGAIQSLQKYISESVNVKDIATVRSLILILSSLLQSDQQTQMSNLPQDMIVSGQT